MAELDVVADVMAREKDGVTALHFAAQCGRAGVIEASLEVGADAKAEDANGKTPWNIAQDNKKPNGTKVYWALDDAWLKYLKYFMALPL